MKNMIIGIKQYYVIQKKLTMKVARRLKAKAKRKRNIYKLETNYIFKESVELLSSLNKNKVLFKFFKVEKAEFEIKNINKI